MSLLRTVLLASVALAGSALAQGTTTLPSGLVRQGNVVMMAPIPDSDETASGPVVSGEKRVGLVHVLSAADHDLYEHAFDAAERGDWIAARGLADQGHDPVAHLLVQWRYLLDKNSGASFADISQFLKNYPDWPNRDTLFARAERAIDPTMDPHAVISWFGDRPPVSDIGKIRLGEALIATGSISRGRDLVRQGWIAGDFDPTQEFNIIQRDGTYLTPEIDRERLMRLIWRNDTAGARREIARVSSSDQRVAEARLALRTNPVTGSRLVEELPEDLRDDPGLIFDRAKLLREQMNLDAIPPLLTRAPTHELAEISPSRWWNELNLDARAALKAGNYSIAYAIASHNGVAPTDSLDYSEAEFLAGWTALRFLKDPQSALVHFRNIAQSVTRPISVARAHYWEGRAYEAQGDLARAWQQYSSAAQAPATFYGQIALARIATDPELHVKEQPIDTSALRASFEHEELTRPIRILADLGELSLLRDFAVHDVSLNADPRHTKLLAEDLTRMGFRDVALRVAKEASYINIALLSYSHPLIAIPSYSGPGVAPDPALVLGIIRQETEFDPEAVSVAGARGIIQVMPGSVRHLASVAGLPYRPNDIMHDQDYALRIGMTELAGDLSEWGGSYVLAIAAYNAGPNRVRQWIASYGDPRDARVDPIDWIEEIPFRETRDYVMRVLENTEVYRNRLAGRDQKLQILVDLYRPEAPQMKPLDYTPPAPSSVPSSVPVPIPRPDNEHAPGATVQQAASEAGTSGVAPKPRP